MCGIIGYIGEENSRDYLISGLEKLEYRGYDSAGILVFDGNRMKYEKAKGRLDCLKEKIKGKELDGAMGIGHTRWATHGAVTDENAHPHLSEKGMFAVVHNGIIENCEELKQQLLSEGVGFKSETDTEVIAQLLEKYYSGSLINAVSRTCEQLEGSFALGIVCKECPDKLICVRRASPLIIGKGEGCHFISSDVNAVSRYTDKIYKPGENVISLVKKDSVSFYDRDLKPVEYEAVTVFADSLSAEKGGFEHFMLKEIYEQPEAVEKTISAFDFETVKKKINLQKVKNIFITACGSAYHAGVLGKYVIEPLAEIPVQTDIASEFRYRRPVIGEDTLVIIISQSGETADSLAALRLAKEKGCQVLSVVNVRESSVSDESDCVILTQAGTEIAVATTKAYSAQLAVMYLLAVHLAFERGRIEEKSKEVFLSQIEQIPESIREILRRESELRRIAREIKDSGHLYFIGRNTDYAIALEASLKMKEISYIHCEAYGAGELKHGTLSLIEEGTPVFALACNDTVFRKTASNIKEVRARGGRVYCFTAERYADEIEGCESVTAIPEFNPFFIGSLEIVPLQLLSYYTAREKGCDIDKPRNLAKSVTVE
ncbi:MAG: glutamine--fructose-6-phosphate transaminase (isomerizing) [Clostridia bacterium]|nr:glutamine--fructose-6-phosphate transaminase (isomerizing) [Clostridia bacterium]